MPLTKDRNTPYRDGSQIEPPVAAGAKIFAGALIVASATGFAEPGTTATGKTYLGLADEYVDNSDGADGDVTVKVKRGVAFLFKNSGSDPVTQASLGKVCYIVDDETVSATDGSSTQSAAGIVIAIDSDGVWIQ